MTNSIPRQTPNFESVWASLQETDRLIKESRENFEKSRADFEQRVKENDRQIKESRADYERRAKENEQRRKENEQLIEKHRADFEQEMKKSRADFEQKVKENDRQIKESRADYERRMKKFEETMGSWANNHGSFAEEYFANSFENGRRNFFGEKFDEIVKNAKGFIDKTVKDEYDILLINGKVIGIIEVKFKAHENDITKVLRKAETFRVNFPQYQHHRIYLGLATLAFYPELEQACINQGIAVIKQVGDTVVINDEHLRAF